MQTKIFIILLLSIIGGLRVSAQITFQKTYGGMGSDEGHSVQQTTDGGYIFTGYTASFGMGNYDYYLIKTDEYGDTLWTKSYGGTNWDYGFMVKQTADGGYIITGRSNYSTGFYSAHVIKTNSTGDTLWTKTFGGSNPNGASSFSIQQTTDGGYIITGDITIDGDVGLIKMDSNGNHLWTKAYGGSSSYDIAYSVQQTTDGGYILTGFTNSFGAGFYDVYLIKTDNIGDTLWTRTFGGPSAEIGWCVQQTSDGGYIVSGSCVGGYAYLIKTTSSGDTLWTRAYESGRVGQSIKQTTDGGFIIAGSATGIVSGNKDLYLLKTDASGNVTWSTSFGGAGLDEGFSVQQTLDGGYIVGGYTTSYGAGSSDFYLIKTDAIGNNGCNLMSAATNINTPSIIFGHPATIVTSGGIETIIPTVIAQGSAVANTQCTNVGVNEFFEPKQIFSAFPNPFTNEIKIKCNESVVSNKMNGEIILLDVTGKEILRQNISSSQTILNTESILGGFYLLQCINGNIIQNIKFVKL
jgi:hypothetical protein